MMAVPSEAQRKRVIVIGGGICGLTAAYELSKRNEGGVEIVVLDGAESAGGWLRSSDVEGILCEQGPRSFRATGPGTYTLQLACDLGLQEQLVNSNRTAAKRFVHLDGALHNVNLWFFIRRVGVWGLLLEFLNWGARAALPADDETVSAFFTRRFGPRMAEVAQCVVGGVFAGDAKKLSLRACFPAIHEMETRCGSLLWAAVRSTLGFYPSTPPVPLSDQVQGFQAKGSMYNFQKGMRAFTARLIHAVRDTPNLKLRLNALVVGLTPTDDGRLCARLVTGEEVVGDHVISTINPYYLSPLATRMKMDGVAKALGSIPHADLTLVNLVGNADSIKIPASIIGFGLLVPDGDVLGVTMDSFTFPQCYKGVEFRGKPPIVLTVMLGGVLRGKEWLDRIDAVDTAVAGLAKYGGIEVEREGVVTKVTRVRNGIPQYNVGHLEKIKGVAAALAEKHITMAGMAAIGPGVNDVLVSGLRAAQCVEATGILSA